MAQAPAAGIAAINVGTIQVGTTGTIGSLMTWELESMKHIKSVPPLEPPRLKHQSPPVSVPCGATPRRLHPRKNPANEASSSSSHCRPSGGGGIVINSRRTSTSSSSSGGRDVAAIQKILTDDDVPKTRQTPRKNSGRISTVLSAGRMDRDGAKKKDRGAAPEKKGHRHSFLVEVVDLKCNNPMSSRLKKLGFSKLSETIA